MTKSDTILQVFCPFQWVTLSSSERSTVDLRFLRISLCISPITGYVGVKEVIHFCLDGVLIGYIDMVFSSHSSQRSRIRSVRFQFKMRKSKMRSL